MQREYYKDDFVDLSYVEGKDIGKTSGLKMYGFIYELFNE